MVRVYYVQVLELTWPQQRACAEYLDKFRPDDVYPPYTRSSEEAFWMKGSSQFHSWMELATSYTQCFIAIVVSTLLRGNSMLTIELRHLLQQIARDPKKITIL